MTHKTKQAALKAARKDLGPTAAEGIDFNLRNTGAGWVHESIPAANPVAVKAKAKKAKATDLPPGVAAAGLAEAMGGPLATEAVAADQARAAAPAKPKRLTPAARAKMPKIVPFSKPTAPAGQSKTEMVIEMLSRPGGATSKEIEAATGWVSHSVRGLIGTLKSKGTEIQSKKIKGEPTYYSIRKASAPKPAAADPVGDVV